MPKKRTNGEGTFYFNENKKMYQAMITTPTGKRLTKASKDESVVRDWLNEQRLLIGRGEIAEPTKLTVGQWFDQWLEVYAKNNTRPRSYERYRSLLAHAEPIRSIKLTALLPIHLQKLYNSMNGIWASQTIKHIHFCISGALRQAVTNNLIRSNPAGNVKTPSVVKQEVEIFTDEEARQILQAAKNHRHEAVVVLAYTTGMRLSEILALSWNDIDLKNAVISVNKSVHKSMDNGVYFSEPKNKSSKRRITIPKETVQILKEHRLKYGLQQGELLFQTSQGNPYHATSYTAVLYQAIQKEVGIKKSFKTFRHTHASMLLRAGVPIQDVSRRLGHAKISTTLDIYSHCLPNADNAVADKISELMKDAR